MEFRIAQGTGWLPVVVLMHGSSGVGANIEPWMRQFNSMGISTFVIDGQAVTDFLQALFKLG